MWHIIAAIPGIRLLEGSSRPDEPLRTFDRFPEEEWRDPRHFCSLVAWPSEISSPPSTTRILFNEEGRRWTGGTGCTSLISPAFVRIGRINPPSSNQLGFNELIYETKASTRGRFPEDQVAEVDWLAMGKLIQAIKKQIQKSASGKWRSIPVSSGTADILRNGEKRLWFWGNEGTL